MNEKDITVPTNNIFSLMEKVIVNGDISLLNPKERIEYYNAVCKSLDLNPLTRPFEFIKFDGKLTLYARKDCAEQLRNKHKISIVKVEHEVIDGVFIYTAYAKKNDGQEDVGSGAVNIKGLTGKNLANAFKVAETQAKRRVTLSICGLGFTDESEIQDIPSASKIDINLETGEIIKDHSIPPSFQDFLNDINSAKTMNELKYIYKKAYLIYSNDSQKMMDLSNAKDKRKAELEIMENKNE